MTMGGSGVSVTRGTTVGGTLLFVKLQAAAQTRTTMRKIPKGMVDLGFILPILPQASRKLP